MAGPYYVTHNAGGAGVGTEGDPFTITQATAAVVAGDTVYVKASGAYNVDAGGYVMSPNVAGTNINPIVWIGYYTTITDGGIIEMEADTNGINSTMVFNGAAAYQVFINFEFWGGASNGLNLNGADNITFKNCSSHSNSGNGFWGDNGTSYINCSSYNNAADGFEGDNNQKFISCLSYSNLRGFDTAGAILYNCLSFANSDTGVYSYSETLCFGSTFDGEGTEIGITSVSGGFILLTGIVNNIFRDCTTPISFSADNKDLHLISHNLYDAKDTDNVNCLGVSAGDGVGNRGDVDGTDAGLFNNEAGDDYTLGASSTAKGVGLDANFTKAFWDDYNEGDGNNPPAPSSWNGADMGAMQLIPNVGGGGLLIHTGMTGGIRG